MTEQVAAAKQAVNDKVTLTKEQYEALIRKSSAGNASIAKEDLVKALEEHKSVYGAAKALGKSYATVKNAIDKYNIEYVKVERVKSDVKRKPKTYTLSEDELAHVNAFVFALKNRPAMLDEIKAFAAKCTKI